MNKATILLIVISFCNSRNCVHSYSVEAVSSQKWSQAYSPYWDDQKKCLYFVDFFDAKRTMNRYVPAENRFYSAAIEGNISTTFMLPIVEHVNQFAVSDKRSVKVVEWNGVDSMARMVRDTFTVETGPKHEFNNYNMAWASPKHSFYGGTFPFDLCATSSSPRASLYRYNQCLGAKAVANDVIVSGGMDWNIKGNKFYFIDTCRNVVYEYDWDPTTDEIYNRHVVFDFKINGEIPDYRPLGMTIDTDGNLYVGLLYKSAIWKINPRKSKLEQVIEIPSEIVIGLVFGDEDHSSLYVTTGTIGYNFTTGGYSNRTFSAESGKIFRVIGLNAKGNPSRKVCV